MSLEVHSNPLTSKSGTFHLTQFALNTYSLIAPWRAKLFDKWIFWPGKPILTQNDEGNKCTK
jgi:hypothetical protein